MHLDLTSLRLFKAVVEQKNIAKASRLYNIAASAISKRLSDLESRLGVSLLYRQKDGVLPTPAGQCLYRHADKLFAIIDDIEAELSEFSVGVRGHIRLWSNTSAVTQFLPEDLAAYQKSYPDVKVELREDTSNVIVDALLGGFADIGIFSDHIGQTALKTRVYRRDTLVVILPRDHPLQGRASVSFGETLAFDHVGLQDGSSLQAKISHQAEWVQKPLRITVRVLSFDGVRRMVESGMGLAILPQGAALPFLKMGAFTVAALDEPWATRSLLLGYKDHGSLPVAARTLVEFLAPITPDERVDEAGANARGSVSPAGSDGHVDIGRWRAVERSQST